MSQSNHPVPKQRPKTEMWSSQHIAQDVEPEYGNGVPTETKPTVARNTTDVNNLETANRELVRQIDLLKAEVTALHNDLNKERAANREREQLLLKREGDLQILQQKLGDERCDLQRERIRLQGFEDELTVMKKDLEHKEFDLRNMVGDESESSAKLSEQEEALQRLKMEVDEKTRMLQQWEASLQHQQHEFSIQQQQHDIAMQHQWEQLQREYAVQQPGYNTYGPQPQYRGPGYPVAHTHGPDLYQNAPQQQRLVNDSNAMPKLQRTPASSGEISPLRAPPISTGKVSSTYQPTNIANGKNLRHDSQAWVDNEIVLGLLQDEEDRQKAYQEQLRMDEEIARKLQTEWGSENIKSQQEQHEHQDQPRLQGQE